MREALSPTVLVSLLSVLLSASLVGGVNESSSVMRAMEVELERSLRLLGDKPEPPYYLAYEVTETDTRLVSASFGSTLQRVEERRRHLDVDLRVGDFSLDNTHPVRGGRVPAGMGNGYSFVEAPLNDDVEAIRAVLWRATDARYKRAVEQLTAVRTNVQVKVEESDASPDFSAAESVRQVDVAPRFAPDLDAWQRRIRRYTAPFAEYGEFYQAEAVFHAVLETRWFVNSEGSRLRMARVSYRLDLHALTKADDGMELPLHETFFAYSPEGLPSDREVLARVTRMIDNLVALRSAPVIDPYTGPAMLSGRAAGVFFHEVLGHRVEGHRQKREDEGQTFKSKVGESILPAGFSVVFDPTTPAAAGRDLAGFYRFDNEGVRAQPVTVVDDGVFRRFLMSRSLIEGESRSNGHGRRQPGYAAVSRQSNLIVEVDDPLSTTQLKERLLALVARSGKPFGLLFEDIQGGFTNTGRRTPNAFNVQPVLVYRVYPNGDEELVRGVDLIGTPLTAFSQISAADDRVEVFNGTCGAESGGVPVSAVSPGLLVDQIEVQRKEKSQERPPVLPAPPMEPQT